MKKYFCLDKETRKIEEVDYTTYLREHGHLDTMVVDATNSRKKQITLDAVNCSLSELLGFLSKIK
jgi:hypothetical protein